MSLSLTQHTSNTVAAGTACNLTISNPTAGNLLVIGASCIAGTSSLPSSVTGFTKLTPAANTGTNDATVLFYKVADGNEGTTLTVTFASSTTGSTFMVEVHSTNGSFSSPLDQQNGNSSSGVAGTTGLNTGSITPTGANFAAVSAIGIKGPSFSTLVSSGFNVSDTQRGFREGMSYDFVSGGLGSYSTTWTWTGGTGTPPCSAVIANFLEPAAAGGSTPGTPFPPGNLLSLGVGT